MLLPVSIDSTSCLLLTAEPDYAASLQTTCKHLTKRDAGLSQREHRRAYSGELRWSLSYASFFNRASGTALRAALRAYGNEPILCPFWPAAGLVTDVDSAPFTGGLNVTWEPDWSAWELHTGATLGSYSAAACTAPVLWSRFDKLPAPETETDESGEVALKLLENGPAEYAIAPRLLGGVIGPVINGSARPVMAEHVQYNRSMTSGGIDVRIERETIGYGRSESEEYVDQIPRTTGTLAFTGDSESAMRLVALFHLCRGNVGTLWWPAAHAEWRLAADVTSASVQLEAAPVSPHPGYLALRKIDGTVVTRRISAVDGTNLTLDNAPGTFARHSTTLHPLFLGRFNAAELKLEWKSPRSITSDISLVELPTETIVPAGETIGTTIGALGAPCWLYHVSDGDLDWYYTSYESEIDAGALGGPEHKPFLPRPIDHGDITQELNLERHDVDLTVGWFAGSPFERARLDRQAPPLTVRIYEGRIAAPAVAELIFTGRAAGYSYEGGKCTCKIAGPTSLFDVKGPVAVTSPRCWTPMYSSLCGLSREALSVAATWVGTADGTLFFETAGNPYFAADHFRYGYAERIMEDGSRRRYSVTGSGNVIGSVEIPELPAVLQAETSAWVAAVGAAGGAVDDTSTAIADALVVDLKAAGLWSKIVYLMPLLGTNLAAALTPLRDRDSLGGPTNVGFIGPDYAIDRGLQGAAGKRLLTPYSPAELGADLCGGLGWWELAGAKAYPNHCPCGVLVGDGSGSSGRFVIVLRSDTGLAAFRWGDNAHEAATTPAVVGHYYGQRSAAGQRQLYRQGELVAEDTTVDPATGAAGGVIAFSAHYQTIGGEYLDWAGRCGVAYLTAGTLTATEAAELQSALARMMYATGRLSAGIGVTTTRPVAAPVSYPEAGWTLVPGCSHAWERCKQLDNSDNYRGCPHFPKANPAMVSVKQETAGGSKK